jgi:phosphatidylinositol-4,5-bisphosphate 4-phosphatase
MGDMLNLANITSRLRLSRTEEDSSAHSDKSGGPSTPAPVVGATRKHVYAGAHNGFKKFFLNNKIKPVVDDPVLRKLDQHRIGATSDFLKQKPDLFADGAAGTLHNFLGKAADPGTKKSSKKTEKKLIGFLAQSLRHDGMSKGQLHKQATTLYKQALISFRNAQPWTTIQRTFSHGNHLYTSRLTPAAQMQYNGHNIFQNEYKGQGVCSGSTKCADHAANLWISEFTAADAGSALDKDAQAPLFRGVRHAGLSTYGLKPGKNRDDAALQSAKEVATAALFLNPDRYAAALQGETVDLKLTSTSLLTAFNFGKQTEGKQVADQFKAWDTLCKDKNKENPVILTVRNADGVNVEVKVTLQVAAFNMGVNEAALNQKLGWGNVDKHNERGLRQLLGDELKPGGVEGGWVLDHLKTKPKNAAIVAQLSREIREIWDKKLHHQDGGEPYKLAQRIALLSHHIGVAPCYNCKSGKDRTGMLDSELKREAVQLHESKSLSELGAKPDARQQKMFSKVLRYSGNLEIQEKNTGGPGNKVLKGLSLIGNDLSFRQRIGDTASFRVAKGVSGSVSS